MRSIPLTHPAQTKPSHVFQPWVRVACAVVRVDLARYGRYGLSLLPNDLCHLVATWPKRNVLFAIGSAVGGLLLCLLLIAAIVCEAARLVGATMSGVTHAAALLLLLLMVRQSLTAPGDLERVLNTPDYELLWRSPAPMTAALVARFGGPALIRGVMFWLLVVGPFATALILIADASPLLLVGWLLLGLGWLGSTTGAALLWGAVGLRLRQRWWIALGTSTLGQTSGLLVTTVMATLLTRVVLLIVRAPASTVALVGQALGSPLASLTEGPLLFTSWPVYAAQAAASGNLIGMLSWSSALCMLASVLVAAGLWATYWLSRTLPPPGENVSHSRNVARGTRMVSAIVSVLPATLRPLVAKDLMGLVRPDLQRSRQVGQALTLICGVLGAALGASGQGFYVGGDWSALYPLVVVQFITVALLGDALLGVTAVESEAAGIDLLKQTDIPPLRLTTAKWLAHTIALLPATFVIPVVGGLCFGLTPLLLALVVVVALAQTIALSAATIGGGALAPHFQGERPGGPGNAPEIMVGQGIVAALLLQILGVSGLLQQRALVSEEALAIAVALGALVLACASVAVIALLVVRRAPTTWKA
ncbi:MAG: hypothetical protein WCP31_00950 [Chloroflexales bacterium]